MSHNLTFPVQDLNCASCAVRAEKALISIAGVESAQVNFATGLAEVQSSDVGIAPLLSDALSEVGKPAKPEITQLAITGMSCASCVAGVETALQKTSGVLSAQVNLATGIAEVKSLGTSLNELRDAVSSTGKSAQTLANTETQIENRAQGFDDDATAMRRAFFWAALLTLPVFVLEMGGHAIPAFHHWIMRAIGQNASWSLQFVLTALVLIGPGRSIWQDGVLSLIRWRPDMNALVVLGSGAAFAYSCVALFTPSILPQASRSVYFEAAAVIITLILAGRWMEARAKGQTGAAIAKLIARTWSAITRIAISVFSS